jgi:arginyl-tRNA--protein-N-Asp/Glu arginylyltransferase
VGVERWYRIVCDGECCDVGLQPLASREEAEREALAEGWRRRGRVWTCPACLRVERVVSERAVRS